MMTPEERRAQIRACLRQRKVRLKKMGLSQDCGNRPAFQGRTLCVDCLLARRRRTGGKPRYEYPKTISRMMELAEKTKNP